MEILDRNNRDFQRMKPGQGPHAKPRVCYYWQAGNCSRFPCPYLHNEPGNSSQRGRGSGRGRGRGRGRTGPEKTDKLCSFWSQGKSCSYGESCRYLHSWSTGGSFSLVAQLEGHQKAVTGIATSSTNGSDYNLYTVSKDETARVWDCLSVGQSKGVFNLGGELGCVITEGAWVFFGLPNAVKAWNLETVSEQTLSTGPVGQVYALVVGHSFLFAGTQDGTILAWRANNNSCFEPAAGLTGHTGGVVTLTVGADNRRMYSGSIDGTIRVWSLETLQCLQTLTGHTAAVTSVVWWDRFLISCSLDETIRVWAAADDGGSLEVTYTHSEEHGVLTLCGMYDTEAKPVLLCSCNDNCVRVYDLPSFSERGKIFSREEVRCIRLGPGGVFFTGDGTGQVKAWRWVAEPSAMAQ